MFNILFLRPCQEQGFIKNFKFEDDGVQGTIKIDLKYNPESKLYAIENLKSVSKQGIRKYAEA